MPGLTYDVLRHQLDWYSNSVSTTVRTTALGVIAAIWAIFTADGISLNHHGLFCVPISLSVKCAFVFAGGALMVDLIQYVSAYWMTGIGFDRFEAALEEMQEAAEEMQEAAEEMQEETDEVEFYYDSKSFGPWGLFLYRLSFVLFPVKLILAILSAVAFLFLAFAVDVNSA